MFRIIFYDIMRRICWILEDIHDRFSDDWRYYPSCHWEIMYEYELEQRRKKSCEE